MRNSKIKSIDALEILDSRGTPTLQITLITEEGIVAVASVPSGASKGENEALELRDGGNRYMGKGVKEAIAHVRGEIRGLLVGHNVFDQIGIDKLLIAADGTKNKSRLGANAIVGVSLAAAKAAAQSLQLPLYRYLGGPDACILPCPMMNIINGGAHADNNLEIQEFLIRPIGAPTFAEAIRFGVEIFYTLKGLLKKRKLSTGLGDEGGFAPMLDSNEEALDLIVEAIEKAGFKPRKDVTLAIDCAASTFYEKNLYSGRTKEKQVDYLATLVDHYPLDSIEDGMAEEDWEGWQLLTERLGKKIQIIGDDLFVTNTDFLKRGFKEGIANSILIKLNQIGTLTETIDCVRLAQSHGYSTVISHRSAETEDTFIADLAVALSSGQIKTGSLSRSERTAKYNRLLTIEHELGKSAIYQDSNPCYRLTHEVALSS